ncbi:MAG: electron transport complex subunit RsxC [Lawsonibacter sp.]|nr:electron transport complex subunit RsxC [Lawsonibacter sp.]
MRHTFFGGVYPAVRKESTRRKPLSRLTKPPAQVYIPLTMSADGPSLPAVRPGDRVTVGQVITRPKSGGGGAAAHSSVSGRVSAIEDCPHPWGAPSPAIIIDNDGQNTRWMGRPGSLEQEQITLELLLNRTLEAGIVGMGGGAYPTMDKLRQAAGRVDTLIVNAAECEPYVTADYRLLLERSDQILRGARAIARCLGAKRAILVTEGDKINAAELVERRLRRRSGGVELCTVRTRYPLGAEKQIVQTATRREVPPGGTPIQAACLVLNVATVFAIQEAIFKGQALTHRAVTVSGGAVSRPRNLWVPIGTPLSLLLEEAGGLREENPLILTGGPMMGTVLRDLQAPVVKNTNSLLCLSPWEQKKDTRETVCIRCGKCVETCPMHLAPTFIRRALRRGELDRLPKFHVEDCISCGCCSFICPANIPLVEWMVKARNVVEKGGDVS